VEAIKACSVPLTAPEDLIEEYFKLKRAVLDEVFKHVKFSRSGKAHLKFNRSKRKN